MSRLLALEWDAREARVVVARRRGRTAVIEQAFAEPWKDGGAPPAGESTTDAMIGRRLAEMLAAHGVRRVDTLVAVGRSNIELRLLALPPAPPEELPDLVRFQALKQFSAVGENWPLDFVPVDTPATGQISVLAAAIAPDVVEQIRKTCAGAEVEPKRLVLRPFAAAALWQHHGGEPGCLLMIDFLAEDVDLTVLVDGHVGFIRTVRLPHADDVVEQARWLNGEAKRTIAAASNQLGGRRADRVVFCGDNEDHADLVRAFEPLINLPLELFDPFDGLTLDKSIAQQRPQHRGRYAPLLGMVVEEAAGIQSGIDFLNPRKAPEPPNRRRLYGLVGGIAAAIGLLLGYVVWSQFADYNEQLQAVLVETAEVDAEIKRLEKSVREAKAIDEFVAGDITWLDEIYHASAKFLPPDKAIVTQLSCLAQQGGGGQFTVEGQVRESGDIDDLEQQLRDALHKVSGAGGQFDPRQSQYPWQFKESISVTRVEASDAAVPRKGGAASEKAASEKGATEKAATEKAASEKAASEKAASEKAASEKAASEKKAATGGDTGGDTEGGVLEGRKSDERSSSNKSGDQT